MESTDHELGTDIFFLTCTTNMISIVLRHCDYAKENTVWCSVKHTSLPETAKCIVRSLRLTGSSTWHLRLFKICETRSLSQNGSSSLGLADLVTKPVDDVYEFIVWVKDDPSRSQLNDVPLLPHSDVTIIVQGENGKSSRAYLAAYSSVFDATVSNNFREGQQMAATYDDIDPSDFAEFLLAIYPQQKNVKAENALILTRLADRFNVKPLLKKCFAFLDTDTELPTISKLLLADELNLIELRAKLIEQLSEDDMKLMHYPHIYMKLSKDCTHLLMGNS